MASWMNVINLGDTGIMIPAVAAIATWLITGHAWRMALWWLIIFWAGFSLVVASKIAFLGWGLGIRLLDFKALSSHAMLSSSVAPVLFYLILQRAPIIVRVTGITLGVVFGVVMGFCLVGFHFHTVSETIGGFVLGCFVSLGFIWMSSSLTSPRPNFWLVPFAIFTFVCVWYIRPSTVAYLIVKAAALYLSGHDEPYNWSTWELEI